MANERSILLYQSLEVIVPHTGGEGERRGGGGGGGGGGGEEEEGEEEEGEE